MLFKDYLHRLLLIPGLIALLLAAWAGLLRMGWALPPIQAGDHGPLMISGFLGTLICLERAIALSAVLKQGRWAYAAPLLSALGAGVLITGLSREAGIGLMTLGSLGLAVIFGVITRKQWALFSITMGLGAICWLVGNGLWLAGRPIYQIVYWWVAFLVLTIAGERLELARILRHSGTIQRLFLAALAVIMVGLGLTLVNLDLGVRLVGTGQIMLALWLLRYDLARRTIKQAGLTRFIAACLLAGYVWLAIGGGLWLWLGAIPAGPYYDAMLHSVLLGFVFSMIFGHAPIILPAVIGWQVPFKPIFYVHLALLHVSLILRVTGDLGGWLALRQWGGMVNVIAILLFLGSSVYAMTRREHVAAV